MSFCPTSLNAYHVVTGVGVDDSASLKGFTIRDGLADGNERGSPDPEITRGAGMFLDFGDLTQTQNGPVIIQCKFIDNYAIGDGGAVWCEAGAEVNPRFINCQFIGNEAEGDGGAAYVGTDTADLWVNCLFLDNQAGGDGGAVFGDHPETATEMVNCTFSLNTAGNDGGGVFGDEDTDVFLTSCILWDNTPDQLELGSGSSVAYSSVEGGCSGTGNNDDDPEFVDASEGDLRLQVSSPSIDSGDTDAAEDHPDAFDVDEDTDVGEATPDLDVNRRIRVGPGPGTEDVDMGAYEFHCPGDCDNDGTVNVIDLLDLLGQYDVAAPTTCDGGESCDFDDNGCVDVSDLLTLLGRYDPEGVGGCPGQESVETLEDAVEDAGLVYPDDWNTFMAVMLDPETSQAEKNNYLCWMDHYIDCHPLGWFCYECYCSICPDDDPWEGH